jgi:cytochrome c2
MKSIIFLLVLFALCAAPFWESEYEKRYQDRLNGISNQVTMTSPAPAAPKAAAPVNSYKPNANGIDGQALFKANCSACHMASDKRSTGPGLKGVLDRIPSKEWAYSWIHNSQELVQKGDAYATKIFNDFNHTSMSTFPQLKNEEIDEILAYVNGGQ